MNRITFPNATIVISALPECKRAVQFLRQHSEIAVDMEGVMHGRDGSLSLIQMTVGSGSEGTTVFLFDITVLGRTAFEEGGLRSILEEESVQKVLFDVRGDADSLAHNYQVRIRNIYDIQVLYACRFSEATDNYLKRLDIVIEKLPIDALSTAERQRLHRLKNKATSLFTGDRNIWDKRPLCQTLCAYAASGVTQLLQMKALWGGVGYDAYVRTTSENREHKFVTRRVQIQGRAKAHRDFSLGRCGRSPLLTDDSCDYRGYDYDIEHEMRIEEEICDDSQFDWGTE